MSRLRVHCFSVSLDDMHFVISPALIGAGERLFPDLNLSDLGYEIKDHTTSPAPLTSRSANASNHAAITGEFG